MEKFVHLKRIRADLGFESVRMKIIILETKKPLRIGSRICRIKLRNGKVFRDCSLIVVEDRNTREQLVYIDGIRFDDNQLDLTLFDLTS